jgi:membrane-associated phospholipid phosphatase
MGVAGPTTALILVFGKTILPFFSIVLIVGWARVALKSHTVPQVTVGGLMGVLLTIIQFAIFFWIAELVG